MAAPKTIAVNEAAYRVLESLKRPGESFSDVIVRQFRRRSYVDLAGAWADEPREEIDEFRRQLAAMRARSDEKLAGTMKRLGW